MDGLAAYHTALDGFHTLEQDRQRMSVFHKILSAWRRSFFKVAGVATAACAVAVLTGDLPARQAGVMVGGFALLWLVGCTVHVALTPLHKSPRGYLVSWMISGFVVGVLFAGVTGAADGSLQERDTWVYWVGFWAVAGAVTAYAYGRVAQTISRRA